VLMATLAVKSPMVAVVISDMNRIFAMKKWTLAMALFLANACLAVPAQALTVIKQGPEYNTGQFEQTVMDINVKVMGGSIGFSRQLSRGEWRFVQSWSDISYQQINLSPSKLPDGSLQSNFTDDLSAMLRNGYEYKREKDTDPVIYRYDSDTYIQKLSDGFRWQDRSGEWIEYSETKKIRAYGNLQGTIAQFTHNGDGQIAQISDRFGTAIYQLIYEGGKLKSISDYIGRSVQYVWDEKGWLNKVTDVSGNEWLYGYDEFDASNSTMLPYTLASITDPEGRVTTINNIVVGGGFEQKCYPKSGGGGGSQIREVVDPDTGAITVEVVPILVPGEMVCSSIPIPRQVMFDSLVDQDGHKQTYVYGYDAATKSYGIVEVDADGVKTVRIMGTDGALTKLYKGDELVFSQAKIDGTLIKADAQGNRTTVSYDKYNNIVKMLNADGSAKTNAYHTQFNLLTRSVDENGVVTEIAYGDDGLPRSIIEAKGKPESLQVTLEYDDNKQLIRTEYRGNDGEVRSYDFEYDAYGNLTKETINDSSVYQYQDFTSTGAARIFIDGRGNSWKLEYDADNRLLSETNPLNQTTSYQYDKVGNLVKITEPNDITFGYSYNARDQVSYATDAYGNTRYYNHNATGVITEAKDELGKVSSLLLDRAGRPHSKVDGNNATTRYYIGKDAETGEGSFEDLTKVQYPTYSQLYQYNNRKQVTQLTILEAERSNTYGYRYDPLGQLIAQTDPNGHSIYYSYDARGNLLEEDSSGLITQYEYNSFGDLIKFTDRNNYLTELAYDDFGRVISKSRAGFGTWYYAYDANDNLISAIDPKGQEIRYLYDNADQLIEEQWYTQAISTAVESAAVDPVKTIIYQYDDLGNLASWQSGTVSGTYVSDKNGLLLSEKISYGPFSKTYQYAYYANGTVKSLTMPDGTAYGYEYDSNNQLTRLQIPGEGSLRVNEFNWTAPSKETLPGGVQRNISYTSLLNTQEIKVATPEGQSVLQLDYQYGLAQEITQRTQDGFATQYQYDEVYRLQQALTTGPDGQTRTETYQLDANSNRIASHNVTDLQYNDAGQLIQRGTDAAATEYQYDVNGNQILRSTADSRLIFIYDIKDRLVRVENDKADIIAAYEYDPFDRRLSKTVNGVTTYFLYADEGLVGEYDQQGDTLNQYGYRPGSAWGTAPVFLYTDSKQATVSGKQYYYYHNDQIGTPYKLTDSSGFVVWDTRFDSFGNALLANNNQIDNKLRFPGQYFDAETGLHYNWRRFYDPETGRYISADPIGIAGGPNLYTYADADPINRIDPNGECAILGIVTGVAMEYARSKIAGDCFSYGIGDAIGDAFCGAGKLAKLAKLAGCGKKNSFTGETLVHTELGTQQIKDIKVGDKVRAFAEWNGQELFESVEDIITNTQEYQLLKLTLDSGEVIESTSQHPFYILGMGWVEAENLKVGYPLYRGDRGTLAIAAIESERRVETVYNLSVANANTYFIGKDKVLVHNAKKGCKPCGGFKGKLGGNVGDGKQGHHVIPKEIWGENQGFLDDIGIGGRRDKSENGLNLPDSPQGKGGPNAYHRGSHDNYSKEVGRRLDDIQDKYGRGLYDKRQARDAVRKEQMKLKNKIWKGAFSNGCGRLN
jgi:RHS repeat-associated protein